MRKPEIQSLVTFVLRRRQVVVLLLPAHAIPNPLPLLIHINIKRLRPKKQQKVHRTNRHQHLITPPIQRFIVLAIDIRRNDITRLDAHIIQCRCDCTGAHGASVSGGDGDEDGMDVGVADHQSCYDPAGPGGDGDGEEDEGDDEGEGPDLGD